MPPHFNIKNTTITDIKLVERMLLHDQRGYFQRLFCIEELKTLLSGKTILQINHTCTKKRGTVRGMHFQVSPYAEIKLVNCLKGEVYDVVIDLRRHSSTFLKHHAEILSANTNKMLFVPEGFAHGFQTLTDDCEILYFHTNIYHPEAERGLNALDPLLDIKWPMPITDRSERDVSHVMLDSAFGEE